MLLVLALLLTIAGLGCCALSMARHWRQVRGGSEPPPAVAAALRIGGAGALAASLALCLAHDHASMAALVWVMLLAVGAVVVALGLARFDQSHAAPSKQHF